MNSSASVLSSDPHFDALKAVTRLHWLLNFEAVATVPERIAAVQASRSLS
jgi:hypothetical protein